eukprot:13415034-Heterocapsa_arctica.AAC.1
MRGIVEGHCSAGARVRRFASAAEASAFGTEEVTNVRDLRVAEEQPSTFLLTSRNCERHVGGLA